MYFLNTDMHMVTFTITVFEIVMLVFQIIYFLQRPSDKSRLQYLLLLLCLIAHNVCSGLLPDEQFPISITMQNIIAYLVGFIMSMYVIYYFYKVFDLKDLRFFATYGLLFFLFLPFVCFFLVPYLLTGDVRLSARLTVVIPFLYALGFIYYTARALMLKFKNSKREGQILNDPLYEHAIVAYISLLCWAALPVIVFFGDYQVLEHSVTNSGFLMMTIIYVRSSIKQSRMEYIKLLESEKNLQQLNIDLKKKVKKRTKKLEQVIEERKTTFINLAHETKTPLTLINNYLDEYIQKNGENKELGIIKNNIDRLTNDMVNFFDVESYEKGFSMYNHNKVSDMSRLIQSKLELFELVAKKRSLQFQFSIQPDLNVQAHPGALDRITNNLVENAIKYSQNGGTVQISLKQDQGNAKLSVLNTGSSIPEDLQEKIFDPYFKLSIPGKSCEGMGMGLSIVKKIVHDLNGEISLKSHPSFGTEVEVSIALTQPVNSSQEEINNDEGTSQRCQPDLESEKPLILLVEDNSEMAKYISDKLQIKYSVISARNGRAALEQLAKISSLDIIISDVMMKDLDGFDFCKLVFEREKFRHIPFIFLTAKASSEDRIRGLELGAIDYIEKPFKIQELITKIDSILSNLRKQREAVINKAYRSIISESQPAQKDSRSASSMIFFDNCKKYRLTAREIDIIKLLIKGQPYKTIGDNLHISDKTVAKHISNIFSKVGVGNKVELINRLEFSELADLSV